MVSPVSFLSLEISNRFLVLPESVENLKQRWPGPHFNRSMRYVTVCCSGTGKPRRFVFVVAHRAHVQVQGVRKESFGVFLLLPNSFYEALPQNCEKRLLACLAVRLSVHMELGCHWTDFRDILCSDIFRKSVI